MTKINGDAGGNVALIPDDTDKWVPTDHDKDSWTEILRKLGIKPECLLRSDPYCMPVKSEKGDGYE